MRLSCLDLGIEYVGGPLATSADSHRGVRASFLFVSFHRFPNQPAQHMGNGAVLALGYTFDPAVHLGCDAEREDFGVFLHADCGSTPRHI
jgi:hypothetical protein